MAPWLFNIFLDMVAENKKPDFAEEWLDTCQQHVLLIVDDSVSVTEQRWTSNTTSEHSKKL